jgi:hypothetical protein
MTAQVTPTDYQGTRPPILAAATEDLANKEGKEMMKDGLGYQSPFPRNIQ